MKHAFRACLLASLVILSVPALKAQGAPVFGQPIPYKVTRERQLEANTAKLTVTLKTDRAEYFPGEAIEVTVSVTNATPDSVEAFEPFATGPDVFWVDYQRLPGDKLKVLSEPPCCRSWPTESPHWFAPGETIERTFHAFGTDTRSFQVPQSPGRYRLYYGYGNAAPVDFEVIPAAIESYFLIPLQRPGEYKQGNRIVQPPRYLPVATIVSGGEYFVIAGLRSGGRLYRGQNGSTPNWAEELSPYVRIATSDQPIISLTGVENRQQNVLPDYGKERITVTWKTADERVTTVGLDSDRKAIR